MVGGSGGVGVGGGAGPGECVNECFLCVCYRVVTVLLQCCHSVVTVLLQCCYSLLKGAYADACAPV